MQKSDILCTKARSFDAIRNITKVFRGFSGQWLDSGKHKRIMVLRPRKGGLNWTQKLAAQRRPMLSITRLRRDSSPAVGFGKETIIKEHTPIP